MDDVGFLHSSPKKEYTGNKTLRSLTIKQLQATEHEEGSTVFYVDGIELSSLQVIGWVTKVNSTQTGKIFSIEDGTGTIDCSIWPSKSCEEEAAKLIEELVLVKITGTLKTYANNKSISCINVFIVEDYNEILYHFTNSIKQHLFFTKQLKTKETPKKLDLSKIQKDIIDCLRNNQDDSGLSSGIICKMLGSSYTERNIQENLDFLVESCYLIVDENSEYKVI